MKKTFNFIIFSVYFIIFSGVFSVFLSLGGQVPKQTTAGANFLTFEKVKKDADGMDIDLGQTKAAVLLDFNSKQILFEKNKDSKLPIASMTKLMTLRLVFDEIDAGRLKLDQKIMVSENAAAATGSQAFLDANKRYSVEELLKAVIMSSANDSCVALAETIAGTEKSFAARMNEKAKQMKLENTHFENSSGLPSTSHYSSARDVAFMLSSLVDNPVYIKYAKVWMDEIVHHDGRKTELVNTNRMIRTFPSCEGGKTGHTNEAGYCHAVTAKKGDMRLVAVIVGAIDSKTRFEQAGDLLGLGFANFESRVVVDTNQPVQNVSLDSVSKKQVEVFAKEKFSVLTKKGEPANFELVVEIGKVKLPVKAGEKVGKVKIIQNGKQVFETEAVVHENCDKLRFGKIFNQILKSW